MKKQNNHDRNCKKILSGYETGWDYSDASFSLTSKNQTISMNSDNFPIEIHNA